MFRIRAASEAIRLANREKKLTRLLRRLPLGDAASYRTKEMTPGNDFDWYRVPSCGICVASGYGNSVHLLKVSHGIGLLWPRMRQHVPSGEVDDGGSVRIDQQ